MGPRCLSLALVFAIGGCSSGVAPSHDESTANVPQEPSAVLDPTEPPAEAAGSPDTPVTAGEIEDICKVYRKALRGRWDDERTRGEIRALTLASTLAVGWRMELVSGDPTRALDASRSIVASADELGLKGPCEPLASLVALAEAMQSADQALRGDSVP